jgi:hypothetical protein
MTISAQFNHIASTLGITRAELDQLSVQEVARRMELARPPSPVVTWRDHYLARVVAYRAQLVYLRLDLVAYETMPDRSMSANVRAMLAGSIAETEARIVEYSAKAEECGS